MIDALIDFFTYPAVTAACVGNLGLLCLYLLSSDDPPNAKNPQGEA